jgi:two-component system sensor histidine kinase TctE
MIEKTSSLRTRLAGTMALLFIGGMLVLFLVARAYANVVADKSYDRLLVGSALSIAETFSVMGSEVRVDIPYAALAMLSAAPEDRVFYRVFGPGQATVTGYDDLPMVQDSMRRAKATLPTSAQFFDAEYRGARVRFALIGREIAEPGVSGWLWVQVGQTRRARDAMAHEMIVNVLLPIALLTVFALALVWFGITRALRPLQRIGNDLAERQPSDLHPVTAPVPAEIQPLIESVNGFMYRLGTTMETLRAFIAEAAHQMRTPLAALRAQAQMALGDDEPADLRRSLRAVDRNAARLSRLLNQLLSDATVIHRADIRHFEPFDLLQAIHSVLHEVVPLAGDTPVQFRTSLQEAPLVGDPLMFGEALKNLIDNALRHGRGEYSAVEIALSKAGQDYLLTVADRGPGIPEADYERVFERFARNGESTVGVGLGLPIVRRAIRSQNGDVTLAAREGGGLLVQVRLRGGSP